MTSCDRLEAAVQAERDRSLAEFDFFQRFPNDDACLEHVMAIRYGLRHVCEKCGKDATFHRLERRPAYSCAQCGAHVDPCAGTIFQDTCTSLQMWFYAIYMFIATRHGVSGKELERQLGVTYKTAWRMGQQIRQLMAKTVGEFGYRSNHRRMRNAMFDHLIASAMLKYDGHPSDHGDPQKQDHEPSSACTRWLPHSHK